MQLRLYINVEKFISFMSCALYLVQRFDNVSLQGSLTRIRICFFVVVQLVVFKANHLDNILVCLPA